MFYMNCSIDIEAFCTLMPPNKKIAVSCLTSVFLAIVGSVDKNAIFKHIGLFKSMFVSVTMDNSTIKRKRNFKLLLELQIVGLLICLICLETMDLNTTIPVLDTVTNNKSTESGIVFYNRINKCASNSVLSVIKNVSTLNNFHLTNGKPISSIKNYKNSTLSLHWIPGPHTAYLSKQDKHEDKPTVRKVTSYNQTILYQSHS